MPRPSIFISHSHGDWRVAGRLQSLLEQAAGNGLAISRSSERGTIKSGENWREWIDDKVLRCDVAIIMLTPGSLRGRWVLWEAGAVSGVQFERLKDQQIGSGDPLARRVRVLRFRLRESDLGPFASTQVRNGLDLEDMVAFVAELLEEFPTLDRAAVRRGLLSLKVSVEAFIAGATEDLRYSPIQQDEGVTQDWIARFDAAALRKDDRWIVAAKRWINVAFLGANNADADEAIDFRIHTRIAEAHRRLGEWNGVLEQLHLAAQLSPNDVVVLRELGRAQRALGRHSELESTMKDMQLLDPDIFKKDREGIALRCGYFSNMQNWAAVDQLLTEADQTIVSQDPYLANWQAIATMMVRGATTSVPMFARLRDLLRKVGKGFWDDATMVNALLALNDRDVEAKLRSLGLSQRTVDEVESATRFYDEIVSAFGRDFDWRRAAALTTSPEIAST
jgi:hypothetical protein